MSTGPRPAWIDQPGASTEANELSGVGVGPTRDEAIDAAIARLAQAIEVRVVATDESVIEGESHEAAGDRVSGARSHSHRIIRLFVDQRLPGVRISDVWRESATESVYARVTLDRRAAAERFDREASEAARAASLAQIRAESSGPQWRRVTALTEAREQIGAALSAAQTRDALFGGAWSFSTASLREMRNALEEDWRIARDAVRISVAPLNADGEALARRVEEALLQRSLQTAQGGAAIVIRCGLNVERGPSFDASRRAARWTATLTALDAQDRRTLATLRIEGVEIARTGVTERSLDAAMKKVDQSLPQFLDELFLAK